MFRVMAFNDSKKSLYEVSSLDRARILAKEYSTRLSLDMAKDKCWVDIRDVSGVLVDTVNVFRPGEKRPR